MRPSEAVVFLIVVSVLAAVYVSAVGILLRALVRRLRHRPDTASRRRRWARRGVLGLAGAGLACLAYALFVEPYRLEVTTLGLPAAQLRADVPLAPGDEVRIVHVSDLHCEVAPGPEAKLPALIAPLRPDVILFTGDAANEPAALPTFQACLAELARIAPVYAVRGNWDLRSDAFVGGTGAVELRRDAVRLDVRGTPLWIAGAPVTDPVGLEQLLADAPADAVRIVLYHYPEGTDLAARYGADLVCAGHTHGGQVALPFYGAIVTLSSAGKRLEAGHYRLGDTHAYVSRGVGCEGGIPRLRFLARPEVTLIRLRGRPTAAP